MTDGVAKSTVPGSGIVIEPAERVIEMDELQKPVAEGAEEPVETPATEPTRDDKGKFVSSKVQGRINELTRDKHDAVRESDITKAENAALRAENAELRIKGSAAPEEVPAAPVEDAKPDINAYEGTHEEFVEELGRWAARDENKKLEGQRSDDNAVTELGRQRETFVSKGEAWAKEHGVEDFRGKTVDNREIIITETMRDVLWNSDDGPAVTVFLANNPAVAQAISELPPSQQAYELGKINATPGGPKTITDAPPPVIVPKGAGGEGAEKDWLRNPAADPEGWAAKRNKELYGR